ncbi:MAG: bifunctional lysylphosphatidylglycerol flippase/synthetase MprF [Vicinamibacterales bacterium]
MNRRLRAVLPVAGALVAFAAALELLRTQLAAVTWPELTAAVGHLPPGHMLLAVGLTAANYTVLTAYDFLALAVAGVRLPWRRVAAVSFLACAVANSVGLASLSGASVRYRYYRRWGVTGATFTRIAAAYVVTFWSGLLLVAGLSLLLAPLPGAARLLGPGAARAAGGALVAISVGYVLAALIGQGRLRIRGRVLPLPRPRLAVAQVAASATDWMLAGTVLYALVPQTQITAPAFLGAFLAAQLLGLASHVPGGLGVFEGTFVALLGSQVPPAQLLQALVVYRAIYYLLPLLLATAVLVADEVRRRREQATRLGAAVGALTERLAPPLLAVLTFVAGSLLLASGATPAAAGRLGWISRLLPLELIELSHFAGSVIGAGLLVVSRGLARRLDAAWLLAAVALAAGAAASLLKGADYEEALILLTVLALLARARPAFDRRAALFEAQFTAPWLAAMAAALGAALWLTLFAFKHVEYSDELWWQFELHGEASRALRGLVGAAVVLLLVALLRLFRHAYTPQAPTEDELAAAARVVAGQDRTSAQLVFLRDKALLFDEARTGFVMYGVEGGTWAAMGDPVGPAASVRPLVRLFLERCADAGGTPVFYEVSTAYLPVYADMGLALVKLGEAAQVDLQAFTLDGSAGKRYRQALRRMDRAGASFRVLPATAVPDLLPALQDVSDRWLQSRGGAEKGFSLGFFDPSYLCRYPVGVIEQHGRIVAFANLWEARPGGELSVDLMRHTPDAPNEVMEALFVHLMLWGREQGYRRFSLGMAPLSGFEPSPVAPLWNRAGAFLYAHGGVAYNFRGLRAFKEKFGPTWEPHYLAYPGGLRLPQVLADVAALIAGGYRRFLHDQPLPARGPDRDGQGAPTAPAAVVRHGGR